MDLIYLKLSIALIVICCIFWPTHFSRLARQLNQFPGLPVYPIIGNIYYHFNLLFNDHLGIDIPKEITHLLKKFDGIFRYWIFHKPYLVIGDHGIAQKILSSSKEVERFVQPAIPYMGQGLISSNGKQWKIDRREINHAFSPTYIKQFVDIFNKNCALLLCDLEGEFGDKDTSNYIDITPLFMKWTLNAILESSLGEMSLSPEDKELGVIAIKTGGDGMAMRSFMPWLILPGLWDTIGNGLAETKYFQPFRSILNKFLEDKIKKFKENPSNSKTIVDLLLNGGTLRSNQNITDHIINILSAGADTTNLGMSLTLLMLANHPKAQKLVQDELDNIFGERKESQATFEECGEMKYLGMCINETLRLFPPIPFIPRILLQDVKLKDKKIIPKGTIVVIMLWDYHRDSQIFPNPEEFNPERFNPEEMGKRSSYDYLSFGGGIRNCIGQKYAMTEMKLFLSQILRKYEVSTKLRQNEIKLDYSISIIPRVPIQLCFKQRRG